MDIGDDHVTTWTRLRGGGPIDMLDKAMKRTERLLQSPQAEVDSRLAMKWQIRLLRQEENMLGLLR